MADEAAELAKIGNILALLLTKGMAKGETAMTLASCGFSTKEISSLTGSAENAVRAAISTERKRSGAKPGKAE